MNLVDRWGIRPADGWLRASFPEPVRFDAETGLWQIYGYPEAVDVLANPGVFGSDLTRMFPADMSASLEGDLTVMDGERHRKLRKLTVGAFTPKTVADLEPRIARLSAELLDTVDGAMEMVDALAYPLPVIVISELLGLPAEDRTIFREMVSAMLGSQAELTSDAAEQRAYLDAQVGPMTELSRYLAGHVAERRRRPQDDLLTRLVEAEVDGEHLSEAEVLNFVVLLLSAGHITTTMLLGNTLLCLDSDPGLLARVRVERGLVPGVIEESLRYLSPISSTYRVTNSQVEVAATTIPADQMVRVWLSAANRDPRRFSHPHRFDPERDPNPHLGFGRGVHFCLGAGLARLEGRVALNAMLDRFETIRVDEDRPPTFLALPDFTGVKTLHLKLT